MLLRGHKTEILGPHDELLVAEEEDRWLLQDEDGDIWRPCDILVVKAVPSRISIQDCEPSWLERAKSYYGRNARLQMFEPIFRLGPWRLVADSAEVRYRRGGKHKGSWRHPFSQRVRLYVTREAPVTYKLVLPDGCIVNDLGFREP